MTVWVALLRGINLGARNKVAMPALREALVRAGFSGVQTYVQSGNVVASSRHRGPDRVAGLVHEVVATDLGVDVPVLVRTPAQLRAVLEWNPFPGAAAAEPSSVHVLHLFDTPPADRVEQLLDQDASPDAFAARGDELVVHYAGGMQASRAERVLRSHPVGVDATARNWRTLTALVGLTSPS